MSTPDWKNKLYYGDNLVWLRDHDHFPNESVDLIYLDPPFNSNADYNVIFNEPGGEESQAQVRAFDDTWHWDKKASEEALRDLGKSKPELVDLIQWLARGDRIAKSRAAYLAMMAVRLIELHRVLKPTGSLYLHCDPTASHYLKVVLDQIFGAAKFKNEIIWQRTSAHGDTTQGARHFGRVHDVILYYSKKETPKWNPQYREYDQAYIETFYRHVEPETGRRFQAVDLTARKPGGDTLYEWKGKRPYRGRYWAYSKQKMEEFERQGRLYYTKTGMPRLKYYLDEMPGMPVQDIWDDIPHVLGSERLGYGTQKPRALLRRIIEASSSEGDVVLDPFCGCGTAIIAAQETKRRWIGIDVTWLAIDLVEKRLHNSYGEQVKNTYVVYGKPYDVASARDLADRSKKEFELWALSLVDAAPRERDAGVDGLLSIVEGKDKTTKVIVQVKSGKVLTPSIVRDLIGTIEKEKAAIGLLITLEKPTAGMMELAVHSGSYVSPIWNKSYPRIQVRTIEELLAGKEFDLPYGESPMKKAAPIRQQGHTQRML